MRSAYVPPAPAIGGFLLAVLGLTVGLASSAVPASAQSYDIGPFTVDLEVMQDGSYRVEEEIRFQLGEGSFSVGFRSIPTGAGIVIRDVEVTSPDTPIQDLEYGESRGEFEIGWAYPERTDPVTFVLTYRVEGGLLATEGENVVEWDPVGRAWEVPVEDVTVRVHWPDLGIARAEIDVEPAEGTVVEAVNGAWRATFVAPEVASGAGMGIRVHFPRGLPGRDPAAERGPDPGPGLVAFLLALLAGLIALVVWRHPTAPTAHAGSGPPRAPIHHTGFMVASAVDEWPRLMPRILGATLVRLARGGRVSLRRTRREDGEAGKGEERLEIQVRQANPEGASALELAFLDELGRHDSFEAFQREATAFQKTWYRRVRDELVEAELLEDHTERSNRLMVLGAASVPAFVALGWALSGASSVIPFGLALGMPVGAFLAAFRRYTRTERGAMLRAEASGFLEGVRTAIEDARGRVPAEAARLLTENLEWMILDPAVDGAWLTKVEDAVKEAGVEMDVPEWLETAVGPDEDAEAAGALALIYAAVILSGPSGAGGGGFSGAGTSVGVGATTGVGGGGGGVR